MRAYEEHFLQAVKIKNTCSGRTGRFDEILMVPSKSAGQTPPLRRLWRKVSCGQTNGQTGKRADGQTGKQKDYLGQASAPQRTEILKVLDFF